MQEKQQGVREERTQEKQWGNRQERMQEKQQGTKEERYMYICLVYSHLTYCSSVWRLHLAEDFVSFNRMQRWATKHFWAAALSPLAISAVLCDWVCSMQGTGITFSSKNKLSIKRTVSIAPCRQSNLVQWIPLVSLWVALSSIKRL